MVRFWHSSLSNSRAPQSGKQPNMQRTCAHTGMLMACAARCFHFTCTYLRSFMCMLACAWPACMHTCHAK